MSFEHATHFQHQSAPRNPYEELQRDRAYLDATIAEMSDNLASPYFNHEDAAEVEENILYFEELRGRIDRKLSSTALIAAEVTL